MPDFRGIGSPANSASNLSASFASPGNSSQHMYVRSSTQEPEVVVHAGVARVMSPTPMEEATREEEVHTPAALEFEHGSSTGPENQTSGRSRLPVEISENVVGIRGIDTQQFGTQAVFAYQDDTAIVRTSTGTVEPDGNWRRITDADGVTSLVHL